MNKYKVGYNHKIENYGNCFDGILSKARWHRFRSVRKIMFGCNDSLHSVNAFPSSLRRLYGYAACPAGQTYSLKQLHLVMIIWLQVLKGAFNFKLNHVI